MPRYPPITLTPESFRAGGAEEWQWRRQEQQKPHVQQVASFVGRSSPLIGGGVVGGGGAGTFSKNGASFIFQTRAGTAREGRGLGEGMSMGMSGTGDSGLGVEGGTGGGTGRGGGGGDSGIDVGRDGFVVGAEGVFPVQLGFASERDDGVFEAADYWVEGEATVAAEGTTLRNPLQKQEPSRAEAEGEQRRLAGEEADAADATEVQRVVKTAGYPAGRRRDQAGVTKVEREEDDGLGSWAADFGLFASDIKARQPGGSGDDEIDDPLTGWGLSDEASAVVTALAGKGAEGFGRDATSFEQVVSGSDDAGATEMKVVGEEREAFAADQGEKEDKENLVVENEGTYEDEFSIEAARGALERPDTGFETAPSAKEVVKRTARGGDDVSPAGTTAKVAAGKSPHFGFLHGLRLFARGPDDREAKKLKTAVRAVGGELYGLNDRLSALSATLCEHPLVAGGTAAVCVSAAKAEVTSLRKTLTGDGGSGVARHAGEVRQAARAVDRRVREAERAVERDLKLLRDAGESSRGRCFWALWRFVSPTNVSHHA